MRNFYSIAKVGLALVALTLGSTLGAPSVWGAPAESMLTQAAQSKVTGRVVDEKGEALVGVKVLELGSRTATMTDVEGSFQITVAQGAQLEFSYVGYKTKVVPVSGNVINVTLAEEAQAIDQVVVVGYGTQKKVNLTGSVASVNVSEMLDSRPVTNVSQALAGMAAGVYVTNTNNRPSNNNSANITIRGQGTLNNSSPLVIIDGVESSLNTLNPTDIETMSILKDAASSSIYGSRAANGVVLVTTKKGRTGKMSFSYDGYVSFESMNKNFSMVSNYADYMTLMNEGMLNSGKKAQFSDAIIQTWRDNENNSEPWKYANNDIMDFYTTGVGQQHNITASGGSDKITFYSSFGYLNNPGVMPVSTNTGYERFNLRTNVEGKITKWLTVGTNLSGYSAKTGITTDNIDDSYTFALTGGNPGVAWMDDQGRLGINPNNEDDPQNAANNPYLRLTSAAGDIKTMNAKARMYVILNPVKGLTIQGSYNYEYYNQAKDRKPVFVELWNLQNNTLHSNGVGKTSVNNNDLKQTREFMDGTIRYENNDWANGKFQFSILGGASQEQFSERSFWASKVDMIDPSLGTVIGAATGEATAGGSGYDWAMRSFFGRLNLGWANKYLIEANFRADASSRFAPDNRWGFFPSFSGAWVMSQENFLKDVNWLSLLKIRGSWGSLGNNAIGNYDWQSSYSPTNYVLNRSVSMGLAMRTLANLSVSWETTYVTNVGVDFGFFNNRLNGSVEYFNKFTDGILIALPAPAVVGTTSIPKQNAAQVRNQGIEVNLGWADKKGDFQYSINGNFTWVTNKVEQFRGDFKSISGWTMLLEGQPININYVRQSSGIVTTQAQLDRIQAMEDNAPLDEKGNKKTVFVNGTPKMGDLMYEDINGDGLVNDDDRYMTGTGSVPPFTFGVNFACSWKGIDFSILFQGMAGVKDSYLSALYQPAIRLGYQINADVADGRWYEGRADAARYPRLLETTDQRNQQTSDFWLMDRSYFKIRNIQLGYTLPRPWLDAIKMQKIRAYVSLENFFTFTEWKGFDPEFAGIGYPTMKQAVIGVNITF